MARHLQPSAKSIPISGSDTSTNFSINDNLCSNFEREYDFKIQISRLIQGYYTDVGLYTYKNDACDTK